MEQIFGKYRIRIISHVNSQIVRLTYLKIDEAASPYVSGPCNVSNGDSKCCISQCVCSVDQNRNPIRAQCSGGKMRVVPYIGARDGAQDGSTGLPSTLEVLDLSDNLFDRLERNTFKSFNELRELNLSTNKLKDFEAVTFYGLKRLQVLDLSNNKFTEVPNKALRIISGLTTLAIGGNPIESLTSMEFAPLSNLTVLNINNLTKLKDITKDTFNGLQGLQELRFAKSKLKSIPATDFYKLAVSIVLGIMPKLLILDLSFNDITNVTYANLRNLRLLTKLKLDGNLIDTIATNSFRDLECLEYLDLSNNKLISLAQPLFQDKMTINMIGLSGNNWLCGCDLFWLARLMILFSWLNNRRDTTSCIDDTCPKCTGGPEKWYDKYVTYTAEKFTALWCTVKTFTTASTTPRKGNVGSAVEFKCGRMSSNVANAAETKWFDPQGKDVSKYGQDLTLQTKEYSARYQFTGKGKLKITNISLQDVGTWTCYDPSTNYTAVTTFEVTEPTAGVQTTTLESTIVSTGRIQRQPPPVQDNRTPNADSSIRGNNPNPTTEDMPIDAAGQPELTKTKVIIGCFVGITLFCAILLIIFYKVRRKQNPNADWETKKVEPDDPMLTPRRHVTHSTISGSRRILDHEETTKVPTQFMNGTTNAASVTTPVRDTGIDGQSKSGETSKRLSSSQWSTQTEPFIHKKPGFYSQPGTLGHTYRTRTLSQSERTNIQNANASCHQIPQSLEKLPLQETAI